MNTYNVSIRCYFPGKENFTQHYQTMPLRDLAKWVEAYRFTHPTVEAITVKLWMHDGKGAGKGGERREAGQ